MTDKDTTVSPYLLRPLRTLEQVLGGRNSAVEPGFERVEERQARDGRDALCEGRKESIDPFHSVRPADHSRQPGHP
jgi:hypothetical protein